MLVVATLEIVTASDLPTGDTGKVALVDAAIDVAFCGEEVEEEEMMTSGASFVGFFSICMSIGRGEAAAFCFSDSLVARFIIFTFFAGASSCCSTKSLKRSTGL